MKDTRINVRMAPAEKEAWEAVASEYGMTLTEFITRSVRGTILQLQASRSGNQGAFGAGATTHFIAWERAPLQPGETDG